MRIDEQAVDILQRLLHSFVLRKANTFTLLGIERGNFLVELSNYRGEKVKISSSPPSPLRLGQQRKPVQVEGRLTSIKAKDVHHTKASKLSFGRRPCKSEAERLTAAESSVMGV